VAKTENPRAAMELAGAAISAASMKKAASG
jgi:hypothetical protein